MHKTILKINKININNFQPKDTKADITINFTKNQEPKTITKEFILKEPFTLTRKLMLAIKSQGKFIVEGESDDILENIYITQFIDEEETEEKLLNFFKKLCTQVSELKHQKIAREYMRKVDKIKTLKLEI